MGNEKGFFDLMLIDGLSILTQIIILVGSMLFIPRCIEHLKGSMSTHIQS